MAKPIAVTDHNFDTEVLQSPLPVLSDFWAPWCRPCRAIAPVIEEIADEYREQLRVVKINVDENDQTADRYGVLGIPTLILFINGVPVTRSVGARTKKQLLEYFLPHLA